MEGKSSYGSVFKILFPASDMSVIVSPTCSIVIDPVVPSVALISRRECAGITTAPISVMVPVTSKSIAVSKFVARSFIPASPAIIAIPVSEGSVALLFSENRDTIPPLL